MAKEDELLKMKRILDKRKEELNHQRGKLENIKENIEREFDCRTTKQMEEKIKKLEKKIDENDLKLNKGIEKLKDEYDWD